MIKLLFWSLTGRLKKWRQSVTVGDKIQYPNLSGRFTQAIVINRIQDRILIKAVIPNASITQWMNVNDVFPEG